MKITDIEIFPIRLTPVKVGYRPDDELSRVALVHTVIVRISTNDGRISGLGEAATIPSYFNQTQGSLCHWLEAYAKSLVGANPMDILGAHQIMNAISGEHAPGCHPARAAVDMALHDIAGKAHGCPVHEILGGSYRTEFELQTNLYEESPEEKAAACKQFVAAGFQALKVKIGDSIILRGPTAENFHYETEKLVAALDAVPSHVYIDADANQSWGNAKRAVGIFENILTDRFFPNLALEQPLHHLDIVGHAFVRKSLNIPLILDESLVSPEAMFQIAKHEAADRVVLKINRVGGFFKACRVVDICEATSIGVSLDTLPFTKLGDTAHCHLAATIRDPYPVDAEGHLWFEDTPFQGGFEIADGLARLNNEPGLGVELDETKLQSMSIPR